MNSEPKKDWSVSYPTKADDKTIYIYPNNDTQEHIKDSMDCDCQPKADVTDGYFRIIHNSFDGREAVEWAKEI